eukprot:comp22786_c0_seq1/m.35676 comp22786_c0_seq1/g.35676  ORF comp22786_c0_seq1/g.35676 comp22786_c0_seq1/m.35676 type:complete len:174 (-) comp22786_c0_seq1:905-1426(-)
MGRTLRFFTPRADPFQRGAPWQWLAIRKAPALCPTSEVTFDRSCYKLHADIPGLLPGHYRVSYTSKDGNLHLEAWGQGFSPFKDSPQYTRSWRLDEPVDLEGSFVVFKREAGTLDALLPVLVSTPSPVMRRPSAPIFVLPCKPSYANDLAGDKFDFFMDPWNAKEGKVVPSKQ